MLVRDAIWRAMRLLGALASGDAPTADEEADALLAFNNLKASWFGTLIGPRLSLQPVAAASVTIQAENGGEYAAPAGASYTVIAPLNPKAGQRFGVMDGGADFVTYPCTVNPNGALIGGASANVTLNVSGAGARWWFRDDVASWIEEADWTDPSNVIEFPEAQAAYFPYMLAMVLAAEFNTELRQDVIAADQIGRAVMVRAYAPRGRNVLDQPLASPWPQPPVPGQAVSAG